MDNKNNKTYKDLLKDPLWVNKSKEIKQLDECEFRKQQYSAYECS